MPAAIGRVTSLAERPEHSGSGSSSTSRDLTDGGCCIMNDSHRLHPADDKSVRAAERIYDRWDDALSHNDPEALLACYTPDAVLESPLVPHILGSESGVCRGHAELRSLFHKLAARKPTARRHYRTG